MQILTGALESLRASRGPCLPSSSPRQQTDNSRCMSEGGPERTRPLLWLAQRFGPSSHQSLSQPANQPTSQSQPVPVSRPWPSIAAAAQRSAALITNNPAPGASRACKASQICRPAPTAAARCIRSTVRHGSGGHRRRFDWTPLPTQPHKPSLVPSSTGAVLVRVCCGTASQRQDSLTAA